MHKKEEHLPAQSFSGKISRLWDSVNGLEKLRVFLYRYWEYFHVKEGDNFQKTECVSICVKRRDPQKKESVFLKACETHTKPFAFLWKKRSLGIDGDVFCGTLRNV